MTTKFAKIVEKQGYDTVEFSDGDWTNRVPTGRAAGQLERLGWIVQAVGRNKYGQTVRIYSRRFGVKKVDSQ